MDGWMDGRMVGWRTGQDRTGQARPGYLGLVRDEDGELGLLGAHRLQTMSLVRASLFAVVNALSSLSLACLGLRLYDPHS
jgi:hypothetical protein